MIVLIDNYDSFTYNLYQQLQRLSTDEVVVRRNDQYDVAQVLSLNPSALVISPGPGAPTDGGISAGCIKALAGIVPILGVCLGHQVIAQIHGAQVKQSTAPRHGKTSSIAHTKRGLFKGVASPFPAMRYHSLMVEESSLPAELTVDARSDDGVVMALSHTEVPIFGVQFHPESFLTPDGDKIIQNFLELVN